MDAEVVPDVAAVTVVIVGTGRMKSRTYPVWRQGSAREWPVGGSGNWTSDGVKVKP